MVSDSTHTLGAAPDKGFIFADTLLAPVHIE
jgi:hypothetical protein